MRLIETIEDIPETGYMYNYVACVGDGMGEVHFLSIRDGRINFFKSIILSKPSYDFRIEIENALDQSNEYTNEYTKEEYYGMYIDDDGEDSEDDFTWVLDDDEILMHILVESC